MSSASATRLYAEGNRICCGESGRPGRNNCGKPILVNGLVADKVGHEFSLEELLHARIDCGRDTMDEFLRRFYELGRAVAPSNLLANYRQIDDLFVVGPTELDRLFRTGPAGNLLGLEPDWIPDVPIDPRTDKWIRSAIWRDDPQWKTRAALILTPPSVGEIPTSLIGQSHLLGVGRDGIDSGIIAQALWSHYFVSDKLDWAKEPASTDWQWILVYEHPLFIARNNWREQQRIARTKKMSISTAAQDVWALNMVAAVYGVKLRLSTWSRTSTEFDGCPLNVDSDACGVHVCRNWSPDNRIDAVAAAVQGVPNCFDS